MKRSKKIINIGAIILLSVFIFAGCNVSIGKSDSLSGSGKEYTIDEKKKLEVNKVDEIDNISIEVPVANVNIIPEERKDVEVYLHGKIKANDEGKVPEPSIEVDNDKIVIKVESKNKSSKGSYNSSNLTFDVFIPKDYNKEMEVTSGVGNVKADNLQLDKLNFKVGVGNLNLDKFSGDITGESGVGNIEVNYEEFNNDINLSSGTGNIKLNLPKDSEFYIDANSGVGDISCDFDVEISGKKKDDKLEGKIGSDKNKITLKSGVGDIKITD